MILPFAYQNKSMPTSWTFVFDVVHMDKIFFVLFCIEPSILIIVD